MLMVSFLHMGSLVLIPMSYLTMTDFDNMLCPFPGSEALGQWWREAMAIGKSPSLLYVDILLVLTIFGTASTPFAILVCYMPGALANWFHSSVSNKEKRC